MALQTKKSAVIIIVFAIFCSMHCDESSAQKPSSSKYSLAVDEITLVGGKKMYGIVLKQNTQSGVQLMVERKWFKTTYSKAYALHRAAEVEAEVAHFDRQLARLEAWGNSRLQDNDLIDFADAEMDRLEVLRDARKADSSADPKAFTLVNYPADQIHAVYVQSADRHRVAGLCWKHNVERVSARTASALQGELEKLKLDVGESFDLSSELPTSSNMSEDQWRARVALLEYRLRKPLEFQGMGSSLIRIDHDRPIGQQGNLQEMLGQFMGAGLGNQGQINELLEELGLSGQSTKTKTSWWAKAAKVADKEGFSGFVVKRLAQDFSNPGVTVTQSFFAKMKDGSWNEVHSLSKTINRNDVADDAIQGIKSDPQVQRVLALTKGLGVHSDQAIDKALRQGAAAEAAMKQTNSDMQDFIWKFSQASDGPAFGN